VAFLADDHRRMLEVDSRISPEVIAARGYGTYESEAHFRSRGFRGKQAQLGRCLEIPIFGPAGAIVAYQLRPDVPRLNGRGKARKYEWQYGVPNCLDFPPSVLDLIMRADIPLLITEGSKKADSAASCGTACISSPGVEGWQKGGVAHREFERIPLTGRLVVVCFDSDVMTKLSVRRALEKLSKYLHYRGASVRYADFAAAGSAGKVGLDDYLASKDEPSVALDALVKAASSDLPVMEADLVEYPVIGGRTYWNKRERPTKDSEKAVTRVLLADFAACIVAETWVHMAGDGKPELFYTIEGECPTGALPQVFVSAKDFPSLTWASLRWGTRARIEPAHGCKDRMRHAIEGTGGENAEQRERFTSIGWRRVNGEDLYIHAGGAIGRDGPVTDFEVEINDDFQRYHLPEPVEGSELMDAISGSLSILHILDPVVGFPLYMAVWRSVLRSSNFSIFLHGRTGSYKTHIVLHLLKHWGPGHINEGLVKAMRSSMPGLENSGNVVGDALLLIDDFKPNEDERQARVIADFLQATGDSSGRMLGRANSTLRPSMVRRGMVVMTGEDTVPGGHSTVSRVLQVEVKRLPGGFGPLEKWAREVGTRDASRVMASYVKWLASDLCGMRALFGDRTREYYAWFVDRVLGVHDRSVAAVSELAAGFSLLVDFCVETGALSSLEGVEYLQRACEALVVVLGKQAVDQELEDLVPAVLRYTDSALASGLAYVLDARDGSATGEGWGFRLEGKEPGGYADRWRSPGDRIGWVDRQKGLLYLIGDAWMQVVKKLSRSDRSALAATSNNTIYKRLLEAGKIVAPSAHESDRGVWISRPSLYDNLRPRVIVVEVASIGRDSGARPDSTG